jgi:hypothetical protein
VKTSCEEERTRSGGTMIDLLLVLLTVAFFGIAWLYVRACERV